MVILQLSKRWIVGIEAFLEDRQWLPLAKARLGDSDQPFPGSEGRSYQSGKEPENGVVIGHWSLVICAKRLNTNIQDLVKH